MRFCVACGAERVADTRFCTGCGNAFPGSSATEAGAVAPPTPSAPTMRTSRPQASPRQLRCVRCGSAIDQGLTCAACSREDAKVPIAEPETAAPPIGDAPPVPAAAPAPPSPASSGVAPPRADPSPSARWVGALAGLGLAFAVGAGHWANQHPGDASRALAQVSPFGPGLDGVYDCSGGAATATLTVSGSSLDAEIPGLLQVKGCTFERHGRTLTIRGGMQYDANGYLVDASDDGRSTLATVGDDGQSITLRVGSTDMRFVKR